MTDIRYARRAPMDGKGGKMKRGRQRKKWLGAVKEDLETLESWREAAYLDLLLCKHGTCYMVYG